VYDNKSKTPSPSYKKSFITFDLLIKTRSNKIIVLEGLDLAVLFIWHVIKMKLRTFL
jgi:hypothetical protein